MRRSLDRGLRVDIEGLGSFQRDCRGAYTFRAQAKPEIFVAYVAEDLQIARRLCGSLAQSGCSPWLDKDKLLPGQNWPRAIERAIAIADVFVACFSSRSLVKRSQFQSELRFALECARRLPLESVFLIPVRLEQCDLPAAISDRLQYVDLFPDWERGVRRIARAARAAARRRETPRLCA
ncbi:MAG: toll/interleukin-1 receptor domain-containing protein [Bryobacterales bacterium]|nr:toll/interleukin-1 receptor domain-containing protein [Bryobacterales bacterium]MBV9398823.1 toll/interleukin-1 receptor domain-containing protein [Bryobacterales bacterium]